MVRHGYQNNPAIAEGLEKLMDLGGRRKKARLAQEALQNCPRVGSAVEVPVQGAAISYDARGLPQDLYRPNQHK